MFIGIPSIALVAINTYFIEEKHHQHLEEHPPAFTPYEHMKIRTKVKTVYNSHNFLFNFLFIRNSFGVTAIPPSFNIQNTSNKFFSFYWNKKKDPINLMENSGKLTRQGHLIKPYNLAPGYIYCKLYQEVKLIL